MDKLDKDLPFYPDYFFVPPSGPIKGRASGYWFRKNTHIWFIDIYGTPESKNSVYGEPMETDGYYLYENYYIMAAYRVFDLSEDRHFWKYANINKTLLLEKSFIENLLMATHL